MNGVLGMLPTAVAYFGIPLAYQRYNQKNNGHQKQKASFRKK
jgi:hypothetical protein